MEGVLGGHRTRLQALTLWREKDVMTHALGKGHRNTPGEALSNLLDQG